MNFGFTGNDRSTMANLSGWLEKVEWQEFQSEELFGFRTRTATRTSRITEKENKPGSANLDHQEMTKTIRLALPNASEFESNPK